MVDGRRRPDPDSETISRYFLRIIEKVLFNRVQTLIKRNREMSGNAGGKNGKMSNLFGHLAVCRCGSPMAFLDKGPKPKGGQYLQCDKARRGLGCEKRLVRYDIFEPMILTYCKGLDVTDIMPGRAQQQSELAILQNQLQDVDGERDQLQREINTLVESLADAQKLPRARKAVMQDIEQRGRNLEGLKMRRETLLTDIETLTRTSHDTEAQLKTVRQLITRMAKLKGQERIDLRFNLRSHLRQLLTEVLVSPTGNAYFLGFRSGERRRLFIKDGQVKVTDALPE